MLVRYWAAADNEAKQSKVLDEIEAMTKQSPPGGEMLRSVLAGYDHGYAAAADAALRIIAVAALLAAAWALTRSAEGAFGLAVGPGGSRSHFVCNSSTGRCCCARVSRNRASASRAAASQSAAVQNRTRSAPSSCSLLRSWA